MGGDPVIATIKDIAARAGVSTSTVSHALNGTRFVSPEKRDRILQVARELAYNPNSLASSLRKKKSRTVGVIIPDVSNFFFTSVLRGVERVLEAAGYSLVLCDSAENVDKERQDVRLLAQKRVDGLIMGPAGTAPDYAGFPWEFDGPVVFIDRLPDPRMSIDAVVVDNEGGARAAVEHLISRGHRTIAIITGLSQLSTSEERYRGYCDALKRHGLELRPELVKCGNSRIDGGYQLTQELVGSRTGATALFVANNLMMIGAMLALRDAGRRVPADVAVIGFDDFDWARITDPPLSVVAQPAEEVGARAAEILLKRMDRAGVGEKEDYGHGTVVRLETKLIVRQSC